jgi:hypothetical protein
LPTAEAVAGDTAIAPVVTFADPDPVADLSATELGRRARRPWPTTGLWPAIIGLLAVVAVLILAAAHHGGAPESGTGRAAAGAASTAGAAPGPLAHGRTGLGPIRLPAPLGNAVRTVPLETIWIVDAKLPQPDLAAFSREAPSAVAYLADYALLRDELGFALDPRALERVRTHVADLADTAAHPERIVTAEPGEPLHLPLPARGYDLAVVVITTRPASWLQNMPAGPTPPPPISGSRSGQARTYIVGFRPGAGLRADPLTPSDTQPQQLIADPDVRGGLARALARAFVDAIGAIWRPDLPSSQTTVRTAR